MARRGKRIDSGTPGEPSGDDGSMDELETRDDLPSHGFGAEDTLPEDEETDPDGVEIEKTEEPKEKKPPNMAARVALAVMKGIGRFFRACGRGIKRLIFTLLNAIYQYFYFVGIQLLRSTRVRRRHLRRRILGLETMLRARRARNRHRMKRRLHDWWRGLTAPSRELRTRFRDFRRDMENARHYGTGGRVVLECLRLVGFLLLKLWRAFKFLLSYAAPIAGVALMIATVTYFKGLTLSLRVEYNGKEMGYISDESVFNQAESDMKARIIKEDYIKPEDIIPKFELTFDAKNLLSVDELTDQLIQASGNELEEAAGLYIQNKFISAVSDGNALLISMEDMLEKYRTDDLDETAQIQFVKKIQVKRGLYPVTSIVPLEEVEAKLNGQEKGEKRYTVVSGDDGLTIAKKNGIPFEELKRLNPEVDVRLMPGDEMLISQSVPYLGVKVKTKITYEEEMDFKIEQQTDPTQTVGYTFEKQKGEKGIKEYVAEVVMMDGVEIERNVIDYHISQEPVTRIIVVGGNKPLKVIPSSSSGTVSSGAFAWPTTGGSITTGWLGYRGHTGSDITFSNCYGAPVYASADGTVVASGWGGMYGNRVIVEHGGGYQTLYAHCSKLVVGSGTQVQQGDLIGYIGRTGNVTGPHLHFEVRVNGTPVNAAPYLYS